MELSLQFSHLPEFKRHNEVVKSPKICRKSEVIKFKLVRKYINGPFLLSKQHINIPLKKNCVKLVNGNIFSFGTGSGMEKTGSRMFLEPQQIVFLKKCRFEDKNKIICCFCGFLLGIGLIALKCVTSTRMNLCWIFCAKMMQYCFSRHTVIPKVN